MSLEDCCPGLTATINQPANARCRLLEAVASREAGDEKDDESNDQNQDCKEYFDFDVVPPHVPSQLLACPLKLMSLHAHAVASTVDCG